MAGEEGIERFSGRCNRTSADTGRDWFVAPWTRISLAANHDHVLNAISHGGKSSAGDASRAQFQLPLKAEPPTVILPASASLDIYLHDW